MKVIVIAVQIFILEQAIMDCLNVFIRDRTRREQCTWIYRRKASRFERNPAAQLLHEFAPVGLGIRQSPAKCRYFIQ